MYSDRIASTPNICNELIGRLIPFIPFTKIQAIQCSSGNAMTVKYKNRFLNDVWTACKIKPIVHSRYASIEQQPSLLRMPRKTVGPSWGPEIECWKDKDIKSMLDFIPEPDREYNYENLGKSHALARATCNLLAQNTVRRTRKTEKCLKHKVSTKQQELVPAQMWIPVLDSTKTRIQCHSKVLSINLSRILWSEVPLTVDDLNPVLSASEVIREWHPVQNQARYSTSWWKRIRIQKRT